MTPAPAEFKPAPGCGRFAPSPTGPLHFGSLVAAFGSFLRARSQGGLWRMRIEDIDTPRTVPGAAELQLGALRAFGLEWDGEVMWQSRRIPAYRTALEALRERGAVFPCRCSRGELGGTPHRGCITSRIAGPFAWRLRVPDREIAFIDAIRGPQRQNLAREVGDVVLWRGDGLVAYQLAVVVDDAAQGVTDVVRGADLAEATFIHRILQENLGLPAPVYHHHRLIRDAAGKRLAKRDDARAIRLYRAEGFSPADIRALVNLPPAP